jgi:chemotaxis protein CheC
MTIKPYTQDQVDALQEVVNIAMGQAGNSLACILDSFVQLSVPRIRIVTVSDVIKTVVEMIEYVSDITAARQAFYGDLRGEALVIFDQNGCKDLADLMGYDKNLDDNSEQELLLDVGNILVGSILNGISETLSRDLSFSAPSIIAQHVHLDSILAPKNLSWNYALLLEVNFSVENRDFKSHLLIFMAEEALDTLRKVIDEFMDSV